MRGTDSRSEDSIENGTRVRRTATARHLRGARYGVRARRALAIASALAAIVLPMSASAFVIDIQTSGGQITNRVDVFSTISSFSIQVEVLGGLGTGVFENPALGDIEFLVSGSLDPTTPARTALPAFVNFAVDDRPPLRGQEFYDLGNSLSFEIASDAVLGDGLQVSELVVLEDVMGRGLVFEFSAREVGAAVGRYHPPLLQLFNDGTGSIRNAANSGGNNPATGVPVNVEVGDEYVHTFAFDPGSLTLVVPEPGSALLIGLGLAGLSQRRRV